MTPRFSGLTVSLVLSGLAHAYLLGGVEWHSPDRAAGQRDHLQVRLSARSTSATPADTGAQFEQAPATRLDEPPVMQQAQPARKQPSHGATMAAQARRLAASRPVADQVVQPVTDEPTTGRGDGVEPLPGNLTRANPPVRPSPEPPGPGLAEVPPPRVAAQTRSPRPAAEPAVAAASAPTALSTPAVAGEGPAADESELLRLLNQEIAAGRRYPRIARRQGREGTATVSFRLTPGGHVEGVNIVHSSRFSPLDEAARAAVSSISPFQPAQKYLTRSRTFRVDVQFALR